MAIVLSAVTPMSIALLIFGLGQDRGDRQRRGSPTDRYGGGGQDAERPAKSSNARAHYTEKDRQRDRGDHHHHGSWTELHDLGNRDLRSEQADRDAQYALRGEFDAGDARPFLREKIEGHAKQKREQHHWSAVMLGQEGRGHSNDQAHQHAREIGLRPSDRSKAAAYQFRFGCFDVAHLPGRLCLTRVRTTWGLFPITLTAFHSRQK
jgi:hypothetical protein